MDEAIMELRIKQWLPIFDEQAKSGMMKKDWCAQKGIKRWEFFKWQRECRNYLLKHKTAVQAGQMNSLSKADQVSLPAEIEGPSFYEIECTANNSAELIASKPVATDKCQKSAADRSEIIIEHNDFSVILNGNINAEKLATVLKVIAHVN